MSVNPSKPPFQKLDPKTMLFLPYIWVRESKIINEEHFFSNEYLKVWKNKSYINFLLHGLLVSLLLQQIGTNFQSSVCILKL